MSTPAPQVPGVPLESSAPIAAGATSARQNAPRPGDAPVSHNAPSSTSKAKPAAKDVTPSRSRARTHNSKTHHGKTQATTSTPKSSNAESATTSRHKTHPSSKAHSTAAPTSAQHGTSAVSGQAPQEREIARIMAHIRALPLSSQWTVLASMAAWGKTAASEARVAVPPSARRACVDLGRHLSASPSGTTTTAARTVAAGARLTTTSSGQTTANSRAVPPARSGPNAPTRRATVGTSQITR